MAFLLLGGCGLGHQEPSATRAFRVQRTDLRDVLSQIGEVRPLVKLELRSEASGRIEKLFLHRGQRVRKGDTILCIDAEALTYQRQRLSLAVEQAKLQCVKIQRERNISASLVSAGNVSAKYLADLGNDLEIARIGWKQQSLELKEILNQLHKTVVVSPMNGVLTDLRVEAGEIVASATSNVQGGTVIGTVADIDSLEVVSRIGEADFLRIHEGQRVDLIPEARRDLRGSGVVKFISLTAQRQSEQDLGYFEVRIAVDSAMPGLVPGVNVTVNFLLLDAKNVLAVPAEMVTAGGGAGIAYKIPDSASVGMVAPEKVGVATGRTDYRNTEILSGLREGDWVVPPPTIESERGSGSHGNH